MPSYLDLHDRIVQIGQHFLPDPFDPTGAYGPKEIDHISAYIFLVHSEIEYFCEELVKLKAIAALKVWSANQIRSDVIWSLVVEDLMYSKTRSPQEIDDVMVERSVTNCIARLAQNNGIKELNMISILRPIGVHKSSLSSVWLAELSRLGSDRGEIAHKSVSARAMLDPKIVQDRIMTTILPELQILEVRVAAL